MEPVRKVVLKKNKSIDKIWHPDSSLVFKSLEEKIVIGRLENGTVIPLDEVALELCEEWKFKYDETLLPEQDENEQDEEETDEQGDTDEQEDTQEQENDTDQSQPQNDFNKNEPVENKPDAKDIHQPSTEKTETENNVSTNQKIDTLFSELQKNVSEKINLLETNNAQYLKQIDSLTRELDLVKTELQDTQSKLQHIKNIFK